MKRLSLALLLCALPFSVARSADPPRKFAFLFAVPQTTCPDGYDCGQGQAAFESYLLLIDGDRMQIAVSTPHLLIPRKSGFWELALVPPKKLPEGDTPPAGSLDAYEWKLWAAPAGQKPVLPTITKTDQDPETGLHQFAVSWVGSDYLSITDYFEFVDSLSNTESQTSILILPIDDLAKSGYPYSAGLKSWSPDLPADTSARDLAKCVSENDPEGGHSREFLESAQQGWTIKRGRMRWEFEWRFTQGSGVDRGNDTTCDTSLRPPRTLVGSDHLNLNWNQILPHVPDAQTAFSSPDGVLLLVFTKTRILAFHPQDGALGKPVASVLFSSPNMVMAQWAVGKYADSWVDQLSHLALWSDSTSSNSANSSTGPQR
jgi:hypothetical protein